MMSKLKVKDRVYCVGQRFKYEGEMHSATYLLAQCEPDKCALINIKSGNRLSNAKVVLDTRSITEKEFHIIADKLSKHFKPIEDE